MGRCFVMGALLLAGACSGGHERVERYTDERGVEHERVYQPNGGMIDHIAGAAVAGAAAGAAGSATHRLTDHAINRWQERKAKQRRASTRRRR